MYKYLSVGFFTTMTNTSSCPVEYASNVSQIFLRAFNFTAATVPSLSITATEFRTFFQTTTIFGYGRRM